MSWTVAVLAVLTAQVDGGTFSSVPTFHEPMNRPVPMTRIDWRHPPRNVSGMVILACSFVAPELLQKLPQPSFPVPTLVDGSASCLVSAQGRGHDCIVEPGPLSEWVSSRLPEMKFSPARYEGIPFETEHRIRYVVYPRK
jgi:hypothetical protein